MENEVFLSYIVPCYNVQRYLPKCLESLAVQKIKEGGEIEYILVNDGSTDETLSLLYDFAAKDKRARVIDQKNQGVCAARNHGLELAKGKYVYFHDGDDILTDEASQLVYDESLKKEADIIIPYAYIVKENDLDIKTNWNTFSGIECGIYDTSAFVDKIKRLPISVKVYKRDMLINNKVLFDEDLKVGEVYTFFLHALAYSSYVALTNKRMMNWVKRGEGTTKGYNASRDSLIIKTMHRIDEYSQIGKLDLYSKTSYHRALYGIANVFGIGKYYEKYNSSQEVKSFLDNLLKDAVFHRTLRFLAFEKPKFNRMTVASLAIMFIPMKYLCRITKLIK